MKKRWLRILLGVFLAGIIFVLIIPMLGLPSSKQVLIWRIERLENWKDGVKCYMQDTNKVPNNLFEVYKYCTENKKGIDLNLAIMISEELSLQKKDNIFENETIFNNSIDYEFIFTERNWFVREKRAYPRFFSKGELSAIDSRGHIYQTPLEELDIKAINLSEHNDK